LELEEAVRQLATEMDPLKEEIATLKGEVKESKDMMDTIIAGREARKAASPTADNCDVMILNSDHLQIGTVHTLNSLREMEPAKSGAPIGGFMKPGGGFGFAPPLPDTLFPYIKVLLFLIFYIDLHLRMLLLRFHFDLTAPPT